MDERIKKLREEHQKRQLRQIGKRAAEINARIIPEKEDCVRTTGPRRQHRAEIINGMLHLTEI